MEGFIVRQAEILEEVKRIHSNFKKDSASRKSTEYIRERLERLDVLWAECEEKNRELSAVKEKDHQYFTGNIYEVIKSWYHGTRQEIAAFEMENLAGPSNAGHSKVNIGFDKTLFETSVGIEDKLLELQQLQQANFRAFTRLVNRSLDEVKEKWEIEDMLKTVEFRWTAIDKLHLQIDGILEGNSQDYYDEFCRHENAFTNMKRALNTKLNASIHQQQTLPKIDIPIFNGNYTLWPTFMDLYVEAIHNNSAIAKTQKMQHLKGRLRGEAEKLVQHLHIAPENYDTCWEILNHRYNNKFLLFTTNFQIFMRQPNLQKQSAFDLKRLYDTTNETINAIHNLGIDTSSWDPILVYVLCEKLDSETYSEYMQSRSDPREIPTYNNSSLHIETHEETFKKIDTQLRSIEEQSKQDTLSSHDVHHYIAIYVVVAICIALFVTSMYFWRKMATQRKGEGPQDARSRSKREDHDIEDRNSKIDKRDSKVNKVSCGNPTSSEVKFNTEKHSEVC